MDSRELVCLKSRREILAEFQKTGIAPPSSPVRKSLRARHEVFFDREFFVKKIFADFVENKAARGLD